VRQCNEQLIIDQDKLKSQWYSQYLLSNYCVYAEHCSTICMTNMPSAAAAAQAVEPPGMSALRGSVRDQQACGPGSPHPRPATPRRKRRYPARRLRPSPSKMPLVLTHLALIFAACATCRAQETPANADPIVYADMTPLLSSTWPTRAAPAPVGREPPPRRAPGPREPRSAAPLRPVYRRAGRLLVGAHDRGRRLAGGQTRRARRGPG